MFFFYENTDVSVKINESGIFWKNLIDNECFCCIMVSVIGCKEVRIILKSERHRFILQEISQRQFLDLETITGSLNASESTVRRDLDELEAKGFLRRVHGGAELISSLQIEESIQQKSVKNIQEKTRIARKALDFLADQDVIFIDAGTTTDLVIDSIQNQALTVVTNSIHHAAKLVEKNIPTVIIGGMVKNLTDASVGYDSVRQISQLNFDKAFIGMNGVDQDYLTTPDLEEAAVKKAIIANAKKTFVLVDESKIGHISFAKVEKIEQVTILTTASSSPILEQLRTKTEVIEV